MLIGRVDAAVEAGNSQQSCNSGGHRGNSGRHRLNNINTHHELALAFNSVGEVSCWMGFSAFPWQIFSPFSICAHAMIDEHIHKFPAELYDPMVSTGRVYSSALLKTIDDNDSDNDVEHEMEKADSGDV